jgi:hypothetical protein
MSNNKNNNKLTPADEAAIRHLNQAITSGKHWYVALLEAIGLWQTAEGALNGHSYHHLISGEALDWLTLSERLLASVDGLLPEDEKADLLFHGKPPLELAADEFKKLIGSNRYHQHLNYFYGVTAEEALVLVVEDEVRKERQPLGSTTEQDTTNEAYQRIYDATQHELLKHFRRERGQPQTKSISLSELKEFTYWRFNYRLKHCDKERVASDTKKALEWLKNTYPAAK